MATAAPNSVAALAATANPFGGESTTTASSCVDDPNFATICSFIQNFGEIIRIGKIPFDDLQLMLENNADVPLPLVQLHITLLRRVFKSVSHDKWERSLAKFGHTYCSQDAWEIERFGYKKAKIQTKLRLLKNLLEAQFDYNVKFKAEVNKLQAADLRLTPLGRDTEGQVYWYQVDEDANLRVYREDIDDETWDIVASNRDELEDLISRLQRGDVKKPEPEETIIVPEEDSNSKDDIEPKEIILDTGKVEDDGSNGDISCESDEFEDGKLDKRTVEPLIIKHSFNLNKIQNSEVDSVRSNIDDVKYEISKSTEDENSPGIKLVFGVKSRPKTENVTPQPEVSVSSTDINEPSEKPEKVEKTSAIELSLPTAKAQRQTQPNTVQSKRSEAASVNKLEETKTASNNEERKISMRNKEPSPTPVDTKSSDNLNNQLPIKTEQPELQSKTEKREPQTKVDKVELLTKTHRQELHSKNQRSGLQTKTEQLELQSEIGKQELKTNTEQREMQTKTEKRELQTKTEQRELQTKTEQRELQTKTEKRELQTKTEKREQSKNEQQQELKSEQRVQETRTEKSGQQSKTEQRELPVPTRTEKRDLQQKIEQLESQAKLEKQIQQAKADKQELEAKVAKKELQSKASKNLQKSAKVNSIVERLNRKLPENSPKTVADLLPPPEFTKFDNVLQKHDSQYSPLNLKSKTEVISSTSKFMDAVLEPKEKSDLYSSAVIQSKTLDYSKTSWIEAERKERSEKHKPACTAKGEEIRHPHVVPGSPMKDAVIEASKNSITSITKEPHALSDRVTVEELTVQRKESKSLSRSTNVVEIKQSKNDAKDSATKKPIFDSPVVPMDVTDSPTLMSTIPVTEKVLEKKVAYICGKEEIPVEEEAVVKENAWVCGNEETFVKEPIVLKEDVRVCGDAEKATQERDHLTSNVEKEKSLQDIPNPPVTRLDEHTNVTKPPTDFPCFSSVQDVGKDSTLAALDLLKGISNKIPPEHTINVASSSSLEIKLDTKTILADEFDKTAVNLSELKNNTLDLQTAAIAPTADEIVLLSANLSEVKEENSSDIATVSSDITPTIVPIPLQKETEVETVSSEVMSATKIPAVDTSPAKTSNVLSPTTATPAEISETLSANNLTDKTLPIKDNITKVDTIASNLECVKGVPEENEPDKKSAPSEVILSASYNPDKQNIQSSISPAQVQNSKEEMATDIKMDASHVPPTDVTPVEGVKDNNHVTRESTPPLTDIKEQVSNITPEIPLSGLQESLPQSIDTVKESSVQNTSDDTKSKESESTALFVKESRDIHLQADETPPISAKVNSSLVLYSESSESSNEAFVTDDKNEKPVTADTKSESSAKEINSEKSLTFALKDQAAVASTLPSSDNSKPEQPTEVIENLVQSSTTEKNNIDSKSSTAHISNATIEKIGEENTLCPENVNSDVPAVSSISTSSDTISKPSVVDSTSSSSSSSSVGTKRKAEDEVESFSKIQKMEDAPAEPLKEASTTASETPLNPIVGDTVEEEVMTITGEGSGAMNEGRNSPVPFNPICGETIEEEIMTITGFGYGVLNEGSNENSPASLAVADVAGSQNESIDSDGSRDAFLSSRGRGGRRGRGRRGRPPAAAARERSSQPATPSRNSNRGSRGSREVARLGVSVDSVEVNGENERPVRASRRIAQIRLKEEEERRKLEEERLAQLKAAQMQKKAKQEEREKNKTDNQTPVLKVKKGKKSVKGELHFAPDYVPSASESEDNSEEEEEEGSDEFSGKLGKGKQRRRRKNGKAKKGGNPWATSDEDEEEEQVEEEEEYHYEEEEEEDLVFKSDHEFSPESDLGEDDAVGPSRHARTAKQDKGDLFEEGNCCKCRKGDHPEWILLCDKCDKGWHASCLRPQLWYIPEGEWFCPPCQHNMLIENLSKNLVEYESLLKKRENEILRKQRLAYVGISLDNVLPDKEPEIPEPDLEQVEKVEREKRRQRRRILSDEELSDDFINDGDSNDDLSRSRSGSSNEDSEDEPVYRLRARRSKKAFNFKEYDDMINSALRVDDDEEDGELEKMDQEEEEKEENGDDAKLNGEEEEDDDKGAGGGKNEAYLKHLEKQAQEEDETDEELLDEKERLRRKELAKHGQKKARRRINDLEAYSDEEDSDDDFKASEAEDDDEEFAEEGESEWSGDKMEEDSDDSIAKRARRKDRQGRHGRLGRREKYSDKGLVRRSTRKRRSRISYDESDDEEDEEEDQNDKWQSDESEEEEESESNSDSDDATWGKKKKKGFAAAASAKPKLSSFVLGASGSKGKGKGGVKRKKRKTDEDDVDRPWNSARGKKEKDEPIERRTRGRKINFKDILDSGESDDDGNVRPKRRPLSDSDDSRSPSSSRRLAEEIRAENARKEREYEENKAKMAEGGPTADKSKLEIALSIKEAGNNGTPSTMPESLTVAKLAESSVNQVAGPTIINVPPTLSPAQVSPLPSSTLPPVPSPKNLPLMSSPLHSTSSPPIVMPPSVSVSLTVPPNSSPINLHTTTSPIGLQSTVAIAANTSIPSVLAKSPPPLPFIPKSVSSLSSVVGSVHPNLPAGLLPSNLSTRPAPPSISPGPTHPNVSTRPLPPNISARSVPPALSAGHILPPNSSVGTIPSNVPVGSSRKSIVSPVPLPVPVPIITEKRSHKQSKGSRSSRGSKSEKQQPPPIPVPTASDLELALSKPVKSTALGSPLPKSSSKKKDRERESSINVPNPSLLMAGAGGVLPELLGMGLPSSLRPGSGAPGSTAPPSSGGSSSKKGKSSSSSRTTQQTTPPPVSQNLSPSLPIDIDRIPNPALFQGNPGMRPFHQIWAVRNPGPPPPGYSPVGGSANLGKPPPLNTSPFSGQQGPPSRPGFPSPPPLRIPNPNTSPLQAFQHFKRDGPLGGQLYRLPPGQSQPGVPLPNILPPGMMSPHSGGPERFFGAPPGYPHPYGLLPPHSQGPPQALFPYDYRAQESPFKDEPAPPPPPPRTTASSLPTPVSSASSSPPPTAPASVPLSTKDEGSAARDSEFGGLVSYFSSQRSEEDMDT